MNWFQSLLRYLRDGRAAYGFHGGKALPAHKSMTAAARPREALLVPNYYYDLIGQDGQAHLLQVQVGDYVRRGQCLTLPVSGRETAQHAATSGVITAVMDYPRLHPSARLTPHLCLTADGLDEALPPLPALDENHSPEALLARIEACGVAGLGGAGFPTARKLKTRVHTLVVNAAECEPYISCDDHLLREDAAAVLRGAQLAAHICGAERVVIGIEDDKPEAILALKNALKHLQDTRLELRTVPARYPSGNSRQLFELLFNVRIAAKQHASDYGYLCHNVGTLKALHDAVILGLPLTERLTTLSGEGMHYPSTLSVRLGTPLSALIQQCGGLKPQQRVILGGPMMGFEQQDLRAAATKICNAVLALPKQPEEEASACIRCGECAAACPMELLPQQLYWYSRADDSKRLKEEGLFDCIECGLCAAICPSHIPLVQYYRHSKAAVRAEDAKQQAADTARQRHEARQARLKREAEERDEKFRAASEARASVRSAAQKGSLFGADQKEASQSAFLEREKPQRDGTPKLQLEKSEPLKPHSASDTHNEAKHENTTPLKPRSAFDGNNEPQSEPKETSALNPEDKLAAAKAKAAARRAARGSASDTQNENTANEARASVYSAAQRESLFGADQKEASQSAFLEREKPQRDGTPKLQLEKSEPLKPRSASEVEAVTSVNQQETLLGRAPAVTKEPAFNPTQNQSDAQKMAAIEAAKKRAAERRAARVSGCDAYNNTANEVHASVRSEAVQPRSAFDGNNEAKHEKSAPLKPQSASDTQNENTANEARASVRSEAEQAEHKNTANEASLKQGSASNKETSASAIEDKLAAAKAKAAARRAARASASEDKEQP